MTNDTPANLDAKMIAAGMMPMAELLKPTAIDLFVAQSDISSLSNFNQWLNTEANSKIYCADDDETYTWMCVRKETFIKIFTSSTNIKSREDIESFREMLSKGYESWLIKKVSLQLDGDTTSNEFEIALANTAAYKEALININQIK